MSEAAPEPFTGSTTFPAPRVSQETWIEAEERKAREYRAASVRRIAAVRRRAAALNGDPAAKAQGQADWSALLPDGTDRSDPLLRRTW